MHILEENLTYLGYEISQQGVKPGADKAGVIANAKPPSTVKEIQSFIGLANYFRQLIPHFSAIAAPLTKLVGKSTGWRGSELTKEQKGRSGCLKGS